jgi:hypothetical protein
LLYFIHVDSYALDVLGKLVLNELEGGLDEGFVGLFSSSC